MALDESLFVCAEAPTLRFYRWKKPCVTFGYGQKHLEAKQFAKSFAVRALPIRRPTGGGVVLHGYDFTFSLSMPRSLPFLQRSLLESYRVIHEAVAESLRALGYNRIHIQTTAPRSLLSVCFAQPSLYDVLCDGKKIAGGAQRRSRNAFLYQGTVVETPHNRKTWIFRFVKTFEKLWNVSFEKSALTDREKKAACRLLEKKYRSVQWNRSR